MHIAGGTESHSGRQLALKAGTERGRGEAPREGRPRGTEGGREGGRVGPSRRDGQDYYTTVPQCTTVYHSVPQSTTVYHSVPQCSRLLH